LEIWLKKSEVHLSDGSVSTAHCCQKMASRLNILALNFMRA